MVPSPARSASPAAVRWRYVPGARPSNERASELDLRVRLDGALRAGYGAGAGFTVHLESGAEPAMELRVDDAASERWAERALFPAYPAGSWRRLPATSEARPTRRWIGRRHSLPGELPLPQRPEAGRLLIALSAALATCRDGLVVEARFRPGGKPAVRTLELSWPAAPVPLRRDGHPVRATPTERPAPPAAAPLCWSMALEVTASGPRATPAPSGELDAVRTAWTVLDGQPLALRSATPFLVRAPVSLLSCDEVEALLPGRDGVADGSSAGPLQDAGVPVGRAASGAVVTLPVEDDQGRHFALLGETGMGKSSLLIAVALRAASRGGLIVLDPLGETAAAVRAELAGRARGLLWVGPDDGSVTVNALAAISAGLRTEPVRAERELEDLVHALRRVRSGRYAEPYWGPRLEEMLVRAVHVAALVPGGTLEDAHAVLASAGTGRSIVPPGVRGEAQELAARVRDRPDDAEGARRLLYEIVRNPTLRAMLCARAPTVDLERLVAPGQVTLISGEASRVGESTARYLLAAYLALTWSALLGRETSAKTFVLLDEAQWFAHEGLAEMLRLSRRRNVHVGVATQSLASLPREVQDAVQTNVADFVVFRGAPADALGFSRAVGGVPVERLQRLARGEAMVLRGKGESVRLVRTARLPSPRAGPTGPMTVPPRRVRPERAFELPTAEPAVLPMPRVTSATEAILAHLGTRAARVAPGELLEVRVGELRSLPNVDERAIRSVGGELGRLGAIRRSGRDAVGPVWWLEPRALADRSPGGLPATADCPQRL